MIAGDNPSAWAIVGIAGPPDAAVRSEAKRRLDAMFELGGLKFDNYTLTEDGFEAAGETPSGKSEVGGQRSVGGPSGDF